MTANKLKRIVPPSGVLDGPCFEYMSLESRFVFIAVLMQAAISRVPGYVRIEKKDWPKWNISFEVILSSLRAMASHKFIELTEQSNTYLIVVLNWDSYKLIS